MLVLSPILPEVARAFGVSTATAGQLRSISGAAGGVTAVLLAIAPRRPGARDLLSAGAALVALGAALSAAAPTFAVLVAAQGVLGIGIGLLVAVGIAAAGEWPAPAQRPHVLAWTIAGMTAAWIAGMPVVGAVLGSLRPTPIFTLALLAITAFANGSRSMVASSLGMGRAARRGAGRHIGRIYRFWPRTQTGGGSLQRAPRGRIIRRLIVARTRRAR